MRVSGEDRARGFAAAVVEELGPTVESVVLAGSHARGDARPDSDVDIWIILSRLDREILEKVGRIVARMKDGPEINPQCVTICELSTPGFRKGFSPIQLHLDGVVLHGRVALPPPTREEIQQVRDELAAFVLMSVRHYITVQEPEEALRRKLDKWLLKPLAWAIRYDVLLRTGRYVKPLSQLAGIVTDAESRRLIEALCQCRNGGYRGDCAAVFTDVVNVAGRMLGSDDRRGQDDA